MIGNWEHDIKLGKTHNPLFPQYMYYHLRFKVEPVTEWVTGKCSIRQVEAGVVFQLQYADKARQLLDRFNRPPVLVHNNMSNSMRKSI